MTQDTIASIFCSSFIVIFALSFYFLDLNTRPKKKNKKALAIYGM